MSTCIWNIVCREEMNRDNAGCTSSPASTIEPTRRDDFQQSFSDIEAAGIKN